MLKDAFDDKPARNARGRSVVAALTLASLTVLGALAAMSEAHAQQFPNRAIRLEVPYPVGGSPDTFARRLADKLPLALNGQAVIVENKPGAGGFLAIDTVIKAKPDGYTILFGTQQTHATNRALFSDLPYDPIKDFVPVGRFWGSVLVVAVTSKIPATTIPEFIAYAKAHPGLKFGSTGAGSNTHIAGIDFSKRAGINLVHVPYTSVGQAFTDLTNGEIALVFMTQGVMQPLADAGAVRLIAQTGDVRAPAMPNLPTVIEAGLPGFTATSWNGIFAPAGTPKDIVQKLYDAFASTITEPEMKAWFESRGSTIGLKTPEEMPKFLADELVRAQGLVDMAGAKIR